MRILQIAGEQYSIETSKIINSTFKKSYSEVIIPQRLTVYRNEDVAHYDWLKVWVGNKIALFLRMIKKLLSSYDILVIHDCTISIRSIPFFEYRLIRLVKDHNIPVVFMCHSQDRVKYILHQQIHMLAKKDPKLLITYVSVNMQKYLPRGSIYLPQPIPSIFHLNTNIQPDDPPIIFLPSGGSWAYKYKGKKILLKALKELKSKGLKFQFREHVTRIPYSEMPKCYWSSTIVFDQIYDNCYGKVTAESFLCGRVALNDAGFPCDENRISPENLTDKLETFLTDKNLREKVVKKGRGEVVNRHSAERATELFLETLEMHVEGALKKPQV